MVKLEIRITYVAWRDGRPRFVPGADLRRMGFKGEDLRHPGGGWYTIAEAHAWSTARAVEIEARKRAVVEARDAGRRHPVLQLARPHGRSGSGRWTSTEDLIEAWLRENPRMKTMPDGARKKGCLAPRTIKFYHEFKKRLVAFDPDIATGPVEALTQPICYDLYERLWQAHGLATARATIATLSAAISWGMRKGRVRFQVNPCSKLGMQKLEPRVRAGTPEEVRTFVATADDMGLPEIGDAIILGVWTGQRQGDRLALVDAGLEDGRRIFRQSKTGAIVAIPQAPQLEARLYALKRRRAGWGVQPMTILLDERRRLEFTQDRYGEFFARVRAEAAKALPSIATLTDQDLRDTAVTWLARSGCTLFEICSITGHEMETATKILKHYLAQHPELADNAIAKLVHWFDGQGEGGA